MNDSWRCECRNISIRFNERPVLADFNLGLRPGERVVITGDSGAGKSTVLRCLLGFVTPDQGRVFVDGEELTVESVWRLRRKMAFVPQEADLGRGRVLDVLHRPFTFKSNADLDFPETELPALLERFYLSEALLQEEIRTLSGGEKQRVAIIAALLLRRPIMLLDEATSALDREARTAVQDYFAGQPELSVLAVTHDAHFQELAHRVVDLQPPQGRKTR
ncbi:MAG: ABC transporter ATP-binding protein [Acidobacteria bacterium]|nr:ABC transporter ATP-binding protein [Acidobacteriota bacterium]